jgi:integrase
MWWFTPPCSRAVKGGWIARNPADHADPDDVLEEEIEPPEDVDIVRILAEAEAVDPRLAVYLLLAAETGARRAAMHALCWGYVDPSAGTARFSRVIVLGSAGMVERPASRTKRTGKKVALSPYSVAHSLRITPNRPRWHGRQVPSFRPTHTRSRTTHRASALGDRSRRTASFGSCGARSTWRRVRLHDLPHYMSTRLLAAGVDPRTVAQRSGWTKVATMLDRYAHALPVNDRAAGAIDAILADRNPG